ncbi:MAG: arsenic resistance protein [Clostridia bacterium]|nr:MAG: arsenic resistance protein [Clostridia bacterium]
MGTILLTIKKRLYLFVAIDFVAALLFGLYFDVQEMNIKLISMIAVFLMLYPMLTGMAVEKVKKAGRNYKLISLTLLFAFFVASGIAFVISRTIFANESELALGIILVGAIPCSNMLIGWSGIADASVEDALVIAVIGLLLIPILSPIIIRFSGGTLIPIDAKSLFINLLIFILIPLILGYFTRRAIIDRKGMPYFMEIKKYFPGVSALGILLIIFFSVAKVAHQVVGHPIVFLQVAVALFIYYIIQTVLSLGAAKLFKLRYEQGIILILGATASSQAISLALASTMFGGLTVFALAFKPILQVLYILFLIYAMGPTIKRFLNGKEAAIVP